MCHLRLTLCLRDKSFIQLGQHDLEGLVRFIIALYTVEGSILQLVSEGRRRVEFDDLSTRNMRTTNETIDKSYLLRIEQRILP
jgi:hypothetical protein